MHPRTASEIIAARFTASVRRAMARELPVFELIGSVEDLVASGETTLAQEVYRVWIHHNPDDPLLHAVQFNFGTLLQGSGAYTQAQEAFSEAVRLRPDFMPAHLNLGSVFEARGELARAVSEWLFVTNHLAGVNAEALAHKTMALKQIGRVFESAQDPQQAEASLRQGLELNPQQRDATQHWIALRQAQCKWPVIVPWANMSRTALMRSISPLSLASYADSPMFQLANAHAYYRQDVAKPNETHVVGFWPCPETGSQHTGSQPTGRPERLRIGYASSDLRGHAVGYLTSEVYELHDRARFEITAYYTGPDLHDPTRARISGAVDHWRDLTKLGDKQAAAQIVQDGIDILVDLNGYTKDGRTRVFALRPAPIIVNWLGYPGTTGSPHHNYIIADPHIIPETLEKYYSEAVRRLPCYQPNDRKRDVAPPPSRAESGLPENAFVFCAFNGTQKLTQAMFRRWMAILRLVPDSVLWLLCSNDATQARLHEAASQEGIAPERLVYAGRRSTPDHVARYHLADLFLDAYPYGAHTTASDALWMGLPVVTLAGRSFASRVCASLVHAAGLGDLVCETEAEYERLAVRLSQDHTTLQHYRERLISGRDRSTLFDTPRLVACLEHLYDGMWEDYTSGHLHVPDLSNLDAYGDIGVEEDAETINGLTLAQYEDHYRGAMAYRHALSPIAVDRRLWCGTP